ncbi:oxidoreductase [Paenibacillus illinoisensis]|uniref:oxidoreductase n=1 Tax=Paenibacillus illinoisensis TaxID=59845 RepID=UPI001C8D6E36|nr:oxidoreductase [Paenibacillus illinoisensis]MBY0217133.1 oxidoreductase [Paenibacillus illinoisensis]
MTTINVLETQPSSRYDELDPSQDGNKNTTFADLIIDGKSLYQMLKRHDLVPALGWGSEENQRQMIQYLLLKEPHDYLYYRYPILVCPLCGDEECGYISMKVDREEDVVIWKDFMLEHKNQPLNVGPFYFMWGNYERAIQNTFGMVET